MTTKTPPKKAGAKKAPKLAQTKPTKGKPIAAGPFSLRLSTNQAAKINALAEAHGIDPESVIKLAVKELVGRSAQKPSSSRATLSKAETLRLLRDSEFQTTRDVRLTCLWVVECRDLAREIIAGEANDWAVCLYWIRLWGLLGEVLVHWKKRLRLPDAPELDVKVVRSHVQRLVSLVESVPGMLSDEQLVWIEYRRHFQAHAVQTDYRLRVDCNGVLVTKRIPLLVPNAKPRELSAHEDAMDRLIAVAKEVDVARAIGKSLLPTLNEAARLSNEVVQLMPDNPRKGRP